MIRGSNHERCSLKAGRRRMNHHHKGTQNFKAVSQSCNIWEKICWQTIACCWEETSWLCSSGTYIYVVLLITFQTRILGSLCNVWLTSDTWHNPTHFCVPKIRKQNLSPLRDRPNSKTLCFDNLDLLLNYKHTSKLGEWKKKKNYEAGAATCRMACVFCRCARPISWMVSLRACPTLSRIWWIPSVLHVLLLLSCFKKRTWPPSGCLITSSMMDAIRAVLWRLVDALI